MDGSDRSNLVAVVALPEQDDYVWKISSEKVPHMTLLFLGENKFEDLGHVTGFIEHASTTLPNFGMSVKKRGTLGPEDADVLFFEKSYNYERLMNFRSHLLTNEDIYKAYNSTEQYPEWTPHLTLGYPQNPAKPFDRDYPIQWVNFDRIALWTMDSDGPTFDLEDQRGLEVGMSVVPKGTDLDDVLEHYGVKGMKWGVRKKRQTEPDSEDTKRVGEVKTRVKTQKTTRHLSNTELEDAIKRMRLEQEFSKLSGGLDKTRTQKAKGFVAKLLIDTGKQTAQQAVQSESKRLVDEQLRKARV